MTWKGINPIIYFFDKVYEKPKKISRSDFKELDCFIDRHPELPKWDIRINPMKLG